jgi:hypothetical protein
VGASLLAKWAGKHPGNPTIHRTCWPTPANVI